MQDTTVSPVALAANKKNTGRKTPVMQSKVERQTDRVDGVTGMGRSKGYGFLEMRTHQDALKVLRWANNNPDVSPLMKEWVTVELEELAQREKEKLLKAREAQPKPDDLDDQELKYKKLQAKVKDGVAGLTDQMKQGKTLLVEFSVENVQVSIWNHFDCKQLLNLFGCRSSSADQKRCPKGPVNREAIVMVLSVPASGR